MKTTLRVLAMTMAFLSFFHAEAQKANYTTRGGITIGFGLGGAYQQSDIANSRGQGYDFTFGSQLYKRESAFLSAEWKFRFLAGENKAYDHRINDDGSYSNLDYKFSNYDLELGLSLNSLRERTRIVITGFAGAGITHGRTFTDLYDANMVLYDYIGIDPNRDQSLVYEDLLALSDNDFETSLINKAAILPTAGIFFGYQFSPSFSIGIEHKTNFSLTEENSTTGLDMDNNILSGTGIDKNHFTAVGFKWMLESKSVSNYSPERENSIDYQPDVTAPPVTAPPASTKHTSVAESKPTVKITDPDPDPYQTSTNFLTLKANIMNADGYDNIKFYQDGNQKNNFTYNNYTKTFTSSVNLHEGENNFRILATNTAGSAEDRLVVVLEKSEAVIPAPNVIQEKTETVIPVPKAIIEKTEIVAPAPPSPVVRIINPESPVIVQNNVFHLRAQTSNLSSRNDVTLRINGIRTNNFNFTNTGEVNTNLKLVEGVNTIEISGRNESGIITRQTTISYSIPVRINPPVINILMPSANSSSTTESTGELRATISNIKDKKNITLNINNVNSDNFSFNNSTELLIARFALKEGQNEVTISALNEAGKDTRSRQIIKEAKPCPIPEIIMQASDDDIVSTEIQSYVFRAELKNIANRSQLNLSLNGIPVPFDFNGKALIYNTNLESGVNSFILTAINDCGEVSKKSQVKYTPKPTPRPTPTPTNATEPCLPPTVNFELTPVDRADATHDLMGTVLNVKNKNDITLTVNGQPDQGFQFVPATGVLSAKYKFSPGTTSVVVSVQNECGSDSKSVNVSAEEPCLPPIVDFSLSAVNDPDATHNLRGSVSNIKNKSDITLTVNGQSNQGFQFVPATGVLSAKFKFSPGTTSVVVSVQNECGRDSKSVSVSVEEPCQPPEVEFSLTAVNDPDATHNLRGSVSNIKNKNDITLTVNGQSNQGFQYVPATGVLSAKYKFSPETTSVVVSVQNECGSDSKSVSVSVEEPCQPPEVEFSLTAVNDPDATHNLRGSVSNIKNKNDITLTVNGQADQGFQFVPATGVLSAKFKFSPGTTSVVVSVQNECGRDSKSVSVSVEEPCQPPEVEFSLTAVNDPDATHNLRGSVSNIKNKSDITLTVNGQPDQGFQFVPATGVLSAKFKFSPGTTSVVVSVQNECGSDSKSVSVSVEEPCLPPIVEFSLTAVNDPDATHNLRGSVSNIKNKNDITLTVNGQADQGFQFVPATGVLSAKFKFSPGTTSVVVSVQNECGSDSKSVSVSVSVEEPCLPPTVDFGLTAVERADATHDLIGTVLNVKNKNDITLTVNGQPDQGFQFVPATGVLSAKFKFSPGTTSVVVSVQNECGRDSKSVSVSVEEPCQPPEVEFSLTAVNDPDATHNLRGSVNNIKNKSDISIAVNGQPDQGFQFVPATGVLSAKFKFSPGTTSVVISVQNECGRDSKSVSVEEPCLPPTVDFGLTAVERADATHDLMGTVLNVKNKNDISLTVNGQPDQGFQFVPATGVLSAKFKFSPGTTSVVVSVQNECGSDSKSVSVSVEEPCQPPEVEFSLTAVNDPDATHNLRGSVSNIKNKSDITLTVNGQPDQGFQFVPATGVLSSKFKFSPGTTSVVVSVQNECGRDSKSVSVSIEEPVEEEEISCGVRINPGKSAWEFCLQTPQGNYDRESLENENFSYSGPATSLYFMPIAGGGDVLVNDNSYSIKSGQYYLFTGNLTVTVSTKNPGSMGQWSVCIETDKEPVSGNGNKRPKSPCETK